MKTTKQEALDYHAGNRPGKLSIQPTKPFITQRDLSLAYTPGVAEPCREIHKNPDDVFRYTGKGNLVAVITNGTAVLGLGNIGPLAGKPVMEGKAILFKKFADIDVFDIEISADSVDDFVSTVKNISPTFGGINLEDVKAPECFEIEARLRKELDIPVFHDDQHGTAIITSAALENALILAGKKAKDVKIVFSGAGAAAVACADLFCLMGVERGNVIMVDTHGVVFKGRQEGMNPYKEKYAVTSKARTLAQAMKGADVFLGLSVGGLVTPDMIRSMARKPIVFALANPDPEIGYHEAKRAKPDIIMATGRSDFPNQVNNVLGFPFVFRGALDVRARTVTEGMKLAAARGLAQLARAPVTDAIEMAYPGQKFEFGPDYIIPKPFDERVLLWVAPAVAEAAMADGVARTPLKDLAAYRERLEDMLRTTYGITRNIINRAKRKPARVVFPEGKEEKILKAAQILQDEGICHPILLGEDEAVRAQVARLGLESYNFEILDPYRSDKREKYAKALYELRKRKGMNLPTAERELRSRTTFGSMMVQSGDADGLVAGLTQEYPDTIRPALKAIGVKEGRKVVSGVYVVVAKDRLFFFADATVNIDPSSEDLAEIAISTAELAHHFNVKPRVAMLSFSNFGSVKHPFVDKVRKATEILHERAPDLIVDGEMQADTAVTPEIIDEVFPFSTLRGGANVLIFPDLQSANIAYKLVQRLADATMIGPLLMGMQKPVNVLQRGALVQDIVNVTAITVLEANQSRSRAAQRGPVNGKAARKADVQRPRAKSGKRNLQSRGLALAR